MGDSNFPRRACKRSLEQPFESRSASKFKSGGSFYLQKHSGPGSSISWEEVPPEIIFEILSRLPVKSVLRCRCVSKTWCQIIDNPCLANSCMQIRAATAEKHSLMLYELFTRYPAYPYVRTRVFSLKLEQNILRRAEHPIAQFAYAAGYSLIANGLGLLIFRNYYDVEKVFLFNPLRAEVLILPQAGLLGPLFDPPYESYGLGFDSTTNTYKVVRVITRKLVFDLHDYMAEVYTLGTTSWKKISSIPPHLLSGALPVSAYGDVHWMIFEDDPLDGSAGSMIVSFDTTKEEFKWTPHPDFHSKAYYFRLLDFRGSLAIVDYTSTKHIEIWVLKDYSKKEWAKQFRISTEFFITVQEIDYIGPNHALPYQIMLVGACEEGVLFRVGMFLYYSPRTDSVSEMRYANPNAETTRIWRPMNTSNIVSYSGSLVSLKNYAELMAKEGVVGNYFDLRKAGMETSPDSVKRNFMDTTREFC